MTLELLHMCVCMCVFIYVAACLCYSPALTAALRELAKRIPPLRKDIQDGLLKMLSMVLMGRPLRHPGAPKISQSSIPGSGQYFIILLF